ncbi:MAG: hypothetical protein H0W27_03405 [Actinobacteria bacterium]|nr:hypothetical protein [Actinomycetota bacterium]
MKRRRLVLVAGLVAAEMIATFVVLGIVPEVEDCIGPCGQMEGGTRYFGNLLSGWQLLTTLVGLAVAAATVALMTRGWSAKKPR